MTVLFNETVQSLCSRGDIFSDKRTCKVCIVPENYRIRCSFTSTVILKSKNQLKPIERVQAHKLNSPMRNFKPTFATNFAQCWFNSRYVKYIYVCVYIYIYICMYVQNEKLYVLLKHCPRNGIRAKPRIAWQVNLDEI